MVDKPPIWWVDKYTDSQWEACLNRAKEYTDLMMARRTETDERQKAWHELRDSMTSEEADAYLFNLTKLGMSIREISESFGLTSVSHRIRRHKQRMKEQADG
jgi:hypothetical protein